MFLYDSLCIYLLVMAYIEKDSFIIYNITYALLCLLVYGRFTTIVKSNLKFYFGVIFRYF